MGSHDAEISILVTDDGEISGLNKTYLGRTGPTNVIAFPMREGAFTNISPDLLGDVVISADTAAREAEAAGISIEERFTELLVHGILHLLGYDHERSESDEKEMEKKARDVLRLLKGARGRQKSPVIQRQKQHQTDSAGAYKMAKLAVNVDHIATIRQARGVDYPDPVAAAVMAQLAGADGIVAHLREDRRHIQDKDVVRLRETAHRFILEMAATPEMEKIAVRIKPDLVTLVPEKRRELTTEGGLNLLRKKPGVFDTVSKLRGKGIEVSMFIDPDPLQVKKALEIGATAVEIHTGAFCDAPSPKKRQRELDRVREAAEVAHGLGLTVNAGHGLCYNTIQAMTTIKEIDEFSIGHSIVSRAALVGMDRAVRDMLRLIRGH